MGIGQRLERAGKAVHSVEAQRRDKSERLRAIIREAVEAGWPKSEIARKAGVSTVTVFNALKNGTPKEEPPE